MRLWAVGAGGAAGLALILTAGAASAETYATGQTVYASPTGASGAWYSGCIVGSGRSNTSYQVECAGTTWWIASDHIRLDAPQPAPDPMRPGYILTPTITPSHPSPTAVASAPTRPVTTKVTAIAAAPQPANAGGHGGVTSAAEIHRRIEKDKADAKTATLKIGKYSCYASGRYTFSDLYITGPHTYRVEPGGNGAYSYAAGALTFASGPYAGAYSRMVDGRTVGVSAKGNTNLGTQCELSN